ncbi:hypothetical protein GCM10011316_12800 [Roseibium aquae]|uniref:DUF1499 domain-containing protein n=1 Tax=Roseibium aquae TaxID=1323746 RepID=A0A916TGK9_9HYPH|nr:DUF1499 domain-containing protein [Roseibium aquae]GGB42332.1 hypothetical protein GCM10011316_12800 [Roseibium aquae]
MNWAGWAATGVLGLVIATGAYIRLIPVMIDDVPARPVSQPPGEYSFAGGHYVVRSPGTLDLMDLEKRIAATPRTRRLSGGAGDLPMAFVHRTWFWGFPDVTQVWVEGGNVHIHSHLIYGGSDLGVNRRRMQRWLAE